MASELPANALSKLASSMRNMVGSQPDNADEQDVEVQSVKRQEKTKSKSKTVETHEDDATVQQEKAAAVVHEDVKSHEHERVDTEVDREIHQDHYHTTIVPVKDKKVAPTEHVYQDNQVEEEIDHRDNTAKKKAEREAAKIHSEKKVEDTTHSKEYAPTEENEHIHHHYHETIQPVIERETVNQKVIHTTNHIHQKEHLNDEHHKATVAPAITMADFEKGVGAKIEASGSEEVSGKKKAQTRSTHREAEYSLSGAKKAQSNAASHSKKREATTENIDVEESNKVDSV